jgi:hypothetical protein
MVVFVLILSGVASAQLSKSSARLEAEITAAEFLQRTTWGTSYQVGACKRLSAKRVDCKAKATGDEFQGCASEPPYECTYVYHSCKFTVAVHQAGYSALGRTREIVCTATSHSG